MFMCMVGVPGSGKSTFAKEIRSINDALVVVSTDSIRAELYGDENVTGNGNKVFSIAYERINQYLEEGYDVLFDATSITVKDRKKILDTISWYKGKRIAVVMNVPYEQAINQNASRARKVPENVIQSMYRRLVIPTKDEGWDTILFTRNN